MRKDDGDPIAWIQGNETATELFSRIAVERPALLLPPLHRVPLRAGNVVEITGPSTSGKSEILLQMAIYCILPKQWKGVHFSGMERAVMYVDLDCRFDVRRLAQCLKCRLAQHQDHGSQKHDASMLQTDFFEEELFESCMRRFLYIRCYNSQEFLASLKTMCYQLQKQKEVLGVGVHFLMIDSIGAFYWMDRSHQSISRECNRKNMTFQSIMETVSLEIHKLLQMQPMLVLASKATILGFESSGGRCSSDDAIFQGISSSKEEKYREYMPSTWQLFVTHRIFVSVSEGNFGGGVNEKVPVYMSKWILPSLHFSDRFIIGDDGISIIS